MSEPAMPQPVPALYANGSEPFKLNLEGGVELRLAKITPHDRILYRDKFRTERKARYAASLRLSGLNTEEVVKRLDRFDTRKLRNSDVIQWVLELDGAAEMIVLSACRGWEVWKEGRLCESQPAAPRTIGDMPAILPWVLYTTVAAGVADIEIVTQEGSADPKALGGNPTPTATGGQTQTGSDAG